MSNISTTTKCIDLYSASNAHWMHERCELAMCGTNFRSALGTIPSPRTCHGSPLSLVEYQDLTTLPNTSPVLIAWNSGGKSRSSPSRKTSPTKICGTCLWKSASSPYKQRATAAALALLVTRLFKQLVETSVHLIKASTELLRTRWFCVPHVLTNSISVCAGRMYFIIFNLIYKSRMCVHMYKPYSWLLYVIWIWFIISFTTYSNIYI